jgi:FlaA1/EpsC-like NDP-sugar epimerase
MTFLGTPRLIRLISSDKVTQRAFGHIPPPRFVLSVASVILDCTETEELQMTPPILVTGGTGTLGHQVVARL